MTLDHPLRRALARLCSHDTMSRIVDPIFADMRWEDGRLTSRGCASLLKALTIHAVTSFPQWSGALWSDDDHVMPKAAALVVATAVVVAAPLIAPPLSHFTQLKGVSFTWFAITLAPQAFALSLPSAIVVAVPLAFRRLHVDARLIRRTLLLSGLLAALTYAVMTWAIPEANESFRKMVTRALVLRGVDARVIHLRPGPIEMDWATLRRQIEDLRPTDGGGGAAARLENVYQLRLAIAAAAVPFGVAGLAISLWEVGRRRPLLIGIGVAVVYWTALWLEHNAARDLIFNGGFLPAYLCAWMPNITLLIAASMVLYVRQSPFEIRR